MIEPAEPPTRQSRGLFRRVVRRRSDHPGSSINEELLSLAAPELRSGERQLFSATGTASSGFVGDLKLRSCGDCFVFLTDLALTVQVVEYADRLNPNVGYEVVETLRIPHQSVTKLAGGSRPIGRELLLVYYGDNAFLGIILAPNLTTAELIQAYQDQVRPHALVV